MLDSRVGAIDRILGLAFGVVRGFVLVVIPYMFAVSFVCKDGATRALSQGCQHGELPRWVEDARSLGMISQTSGTLYGILSRYVPSALSGEQQQGHSTRIFTTTPSPHPMASRCNLAYIQGAPRTRVPERDGGAWC